MLSAHLVGPVAHLVEHLLCKQGVAGSNPARSTSCVGESPSGKAAGFGPAIRGFESFLPSHCSLMPDFNVGLFLMLMYPAPTLLTNGCVVAVGNFDGVHAGHKALLAVAKIEAERWELPLVVLTFEPHPRAVLFPQVPLHRLTGVLEKENRLKAEGVAEMVVVPFALEVAGWSPDMFVKDVIVEWLGAKVVVVGENFRYGHKAAGDVASLAADRRFATVVVPLLTDAGGIISSRRLREGLTS